jgi:hypothetical protein
MNRLFYFGQAGDERFLAERRKFIKNTGMLLGLMGVAPGLRFETSQKLLKAVGLNSLYAQAALPAFPHHLIEVCFRTGFNFRSVLPPARAAVVQNDRMAVWAGSTDDSGSYQNYRVLQSNDPMTGTGVWLPSLNNQIVHAAQVPMAHFAYSLGTVTHAPNFNIRAGIAESTATQTNTGEPNFMDLHSGLVAHHALFAASLKLRINASGETPAVIHNFNPGFDTAFSPLKFGGTEGVLAANLGKNSLALSNLLNGKVDLLKASMASIEQNQLAPLMTEINRLAQSRLTQLQVTNPVTLLKSPEALKKVFASQVSSLLTLSAEEQALFGAGSNFDIFCPDANGNNTGRYGTYNLGFWLGTLAKAFEVGLIQRAVIEVEVTDHHADANNSAGGLNLGNGGWQRDQMKTGLGILKAVEGFHTYAKQRTSLASEQSLFDDSMIVMTSDLGRRPNTRVEANETTSADNASGGNGAYTDTGNGSAIVVGSNRLIHSGTFFNHTADHLEMRYPDSQSNGAIAKDASTHNSATLSPTGPQAWEMTARAVVGDDNIKRYKGSTHTFGPYSYLLKR